MTKLAADAPVVEARVREALDLVPIIAHQMRRRIGPSLEVAELESMGREGLLDAARSFDADRGVPFRRWANLRIRGAVIDGVRSLGGLPRRVYRTLRAIEGADRVQDAYAEEHAAAAAGGAGGAEAADARLAQNLSGMALAMAAGFLAPETEGIDQVKDLGESPEEAVGRQQLLAAIRAAIARRPEAERVLLERHYFEGVTFDEAARGIGLSKSWASRLHARAIEAIALELDSPGP